MKWNRYRLTTTTQAVDLVSAMLSELGIEGIEIEDKVPLSKEDQEKMFIDILPEPEQDDGVAYVMFYVDAEADDGTTADQVLEELEILRNFTDVGAGTLEQSVTADEDWINNWKQYWKPFYVDEKILIRPSWEPCPQVEPDTMVVELDPGTSFGTGTHHTTKLCIRQLKKYLQPGQQLLDVGCGSGILFIIGILLGAGCAVATDIDPHAVESAEENAKRNHIGKVRILQGDVVKDADFRSTVGDGCFDVVTANILADVIISLSGTICACMKPGGIFISSGILNTKEEDVRQALLANGFEILEVTRSGEWSAFTAKASDSGHSQEV